MLAGVRLHQKQIILTNSVIATWEQTGIVRAIYCAAVFDHINTEEVVDQHLYTIP